MGNGKWETGIGQYWELGIRGENWDGGNWAVLVGVGNREFVVEIWMVGIVGNGKREMGNGNWAVLGMLNSWWELGWWELGRHSGNWKFVVEIWMVGIWPS